MIALSLGKRFYERGRNASPLSGKRVCRGRNASPLPGERVSRDGAFSSRRGTGEGLLSSQQMRLTRNSQP